MVENPDGAYCVSRSPVSRGAAHNLSVVIHLDGRCFTCHLAKATGTVHALHAAQSDTCHACAKSRCERCIMWLMLSSERDAPMHPNVCHAGTAAIVIAPEPVPHRHRSHRHRPGTCAPQAPRPSSSPRNGSSAAHMRCEAAQQIKLEIRDRIVV